MQVTPTDIPDVLLIQPNLFGDERGRFQEIWNQQRYTDAGIPATFVQDNLSRSTRGTLRGLHYQLQQTQGKLIQVLQGEIFDVAVDLRRNSATFGRWVGMTLDSTTSHQVWIPPGFAHGFLVLSDIADVYYKCTNLYLPSAERSLGWNDPDLKIKWPLEGEPNLSSKDRAGTSFAAAEVFEHD
jgi:dTDP-4-dehydrorhamnose 3,5-epimerase